jgi:hypothetical protein
MKTNVFETSVGMLREWTFIAAKRHQKISKGVCL